MRHTVKRQDSSRGDHPATLDVRQNSTFKNNQPQNKSLRPPHCKQTKSKKGTASSSKTMVRTNACCVRSSIDVHVVDIAKYDYIYIASVFKNLHAPARTFLTEHVCDASSLRCLRICQRLRNCRTAKNST